MKLTFTRKMPTAEKIAKALGISSRITLETTRDTIAIDTGDYILTSSQKTKLITLAAERGYQIEESS